MKTLKILTAWLGIIFIVWFSGCASTIKPGNHGLIWRPWSSGLDTTRVFDNGVKWHWPWNNVIEYNTRWRSYSEKVALLTSDDLHIDATVSILIRPNYNYLPKLHLYIGPSWYQNIVRPEFMKVTRDIFAEYIHTEIPKKSPEIGKKITMAMDKLLEGKYLEMEKVTIDHVMYSKVVTEAVDKKLATKHRLEQQEYEIGIAEKFAEIQRIRARGQKDAEEIIAEGLTRAYLQYKSLEVQEKLATSNNATFYFVPIGKDGLPIILEAVAKEKNDSLRKPRN